MKRDPLDRGTYGAGWVRGEIAKAEAQDAEADWDEVEPPLPDAFDRLTDQGDLDAEASPWSRVIMAGVFVGLCIVAALLAGAFWAMWR